jgi:hypothetical protein
MLEMMRSIVVVLLGVLLSAVLVAVAGYLVAKSSETKLVLQAAAAHAAGRQINSPVKNERFWHSLRIGAVRITWPYCPTIAIVVGAFVGLLSFRSQILLVYSALRLFRFLFQSVCTELFREFRFCACIWRWEQLGRICHLACQGGERLRN